MRQFVIKMVQIFIELNSNMLYRFDQWWGPPNDVRSGFSLRPGLLICAKYINIYVYNNGIRPALRPGLIVCNHHEKIS